MRVRAALITVTSIWALAFPIACRMALALVVMDVRGILPMRGTVILIIVIAAGAVPVIPIRMFITLIAVGRMWAMASISANRVATTSGAIVVVMVTHMPVVVVRVAIVVVKPVIVVGIGVAGRCVVSVIAV
jgi:hypothetical protein